MEPGAFQLFCLCGKNESHCRYWEGKKNIHRSVDYRHVLTNQIWLYKFLVRAPTLFMTLDAITCLLTLTTERLNSNVVLQNIPRHTNTHAYHWNTHIEASKAHLNTHIYTTHFPRVAGGCYLLLAFISQRPALFVLIAVSDTEPSVHIALLCGVEIVFPAPFFSCNNQVKCHASLCNKQW